MVVYFGPEVEKALKKYLEVRENITPLAGHEHALFYSTNVAGSVFRLSRIWLKNMPGRSQLQKRSPRISFAAPMVLPCTRKPVIFTL